MQTNEETRLCIREGFAAAMSRHRITALFLTAAVLAFPAQAIAQALSADDLMDMPLENLAEVEVLITGASKYAEKASESPSVVEVITAEDIEAYGYRTLGEALNGLHGLYLNNDRNYSTLGVRDFLLTGTTNSRILIMVDGRRMNENVFDSAYVGQEFMLDMDLVSRIEYISGPGSSIYGANAMMGVVNVVTKKGSDINGVQVAAGGGTFKTTKVRATYGGTLGNGADVMLSASGFNTNGVSNLYFFEFDDPTTNNGIAHEMDGERTRRFFAKAEKNGFTYTAGYVDRFKQVPTRAFSTIFNDPGFKTDDSHAYNELKYANAFNDKTQVELKGFYHRYRNKAQYPYDDVPPRYILFDQYGGDWAGGEATFVTTAFDRQKIIFGAEFQWDISQKLFAYDRYGVYQDTDRNGIRSGLYAQDAISLRDDLVLNVGLRLDQHHLIEKYQVNPRAGLIWNPHPSTTMKLLYASAFRAPNAMERDYDAFSSWVANPNNKEEQIKNYEAVAEWQDKNGLKLSGSVYFNEFRDVLSKNYTSTSPDYHMFTNTGNLKSLGFEVAVEKQWDNGRELKGNINHTEYIDHVGTAWGAVDDPKTVAKVRYTEPLFDGRAKLGIENVYVGPRTTLYYTEENSYNLTNANITAKNILPGTDISFGVYNLFNATWDMIGGPDVRQEVIPMSGRNVLLTVRKTF